MIELEALELHPVSIPMRHRFRRVDTREAVLIKGPTGWGEFSPFPEYPPEVTTRWLAAALELACSQLPAPGRETVPVNVTVPAVDPDLAMALVNESGATTAKVKVGAADDEDVARVASVRETLGPSGRIRVDVNGSWTLNRAVEAIRLLEPFDLEYVEQPVATLEEMKELKRRVPVPLAADELIRNSQHPLETMSEVEADVVILKVQPMGGVSRVLDLAARSPVPVVISSALETSVGMYGGLLAASLIADSGMANGLGTVALNVGDPTPDPLAPFEGYLEVRRPEPTEELLERWQPTKEVRSELLRRLRAAAEILT